MIQHIPEDMTATVDAGMMLAELQMRLGERGQWLPIDPARPDRLTLGALIANNESGPRRFAYGTIRDHLLGIKVTLADGRQIKAGGKVVKNVAGYDLCKLFIGSRGSLGTITEATFKLRPLPETEQFLQIQCKSLAEVAEITEKIFDSPLTPVVFDLHNLESRFNASPLPRFHVVLGFAGTREEVDWQLEETGKLGIREPSNLDHDAKFWAVPEGGTLNKLSVLPAKVTEAIASLGPVPFVARAGNGLLWYRGPARVAGHDSPADVALDRLQQRVKEAYDPKHLLPSISQ